MPKTKLCDVVQVADVSVFDAGTWDGFDVDAFRARIKQDSGPGIEAVCRCCGQKGFAIGRSEPAVRHALGDVKSFCECDDKAGDPIYSAGDGSDGHWTWPDEIAKRAKTVSWT